MANHSWVLVILLITLKPDSILAVSPESRLWLFNTSNYRPPTATVSTILYNNNNDESIYESEMDNIDDGEIYDEEDDFSENNTPAMTVSQPKLNNITSQLNEDTNIDEYGDETGSFQEGDDDDQEENHIYADTMSVDRTQVNRPTIASENKKPIDSPSTSRMPFDSSNLWRNLFSKPAILVGIIGGIVIGMLSAILLVMFIIYRMRKKDEGSYALEEAPRKSPSHAYTRVSSREFFA